MTDNESTAVLSVGLIVGGRTATNRGWVEAVRELTREIATRREGVRSEINVNVEFQIPGNLLTPDFEGVRTGAFRKADSLLKVQVALPSDAPAEPRPALLAYVAAALDAVDAWAIAKRRTIDTTALRALLAALETPDG